MDKKTDKSEKIDLTLILPCYNEAEHIHKSIPRIIAVLENSKYSYELILIDDKSTDNTADLIKKLNKQYSKMHIYFHDKNQGRGATVTEGLRLAKAEVAGFIDIDLEVSPGYIPEIVSILKNGKTDVIVGYRHYPFIFLPLNSLMRFLSTKIYSFIVKSVLKLPIHDTESGYKFFNRKKIVKVLRKIKDKHWFWDTEIIAHSVLEGLRTKEIPVLFLKNPNKTSTVNLFSDAMQYLIALYRFKKSLKHRKSNKATI